MVELVIWTYDWMPEMPRGFVRDTRLRWACEEAGLDYEVRTVSFENRGAEHPERQPFGQAGGNAGMGDCCAELDRTGVSALVVP